MKKYYYEGPTFKLCRGSWDLLLNFEGGPGFPLLNFGEIPGPTFKLWGGSQIPGPGLLVLLLHHAIFYVMQPMLKNNFFSKF